MPERRRFAVLWDMDGTLVDTAELHFRAWRALAQELGQPFTRADFAGTFGWRNPEIIPKIFGPRYDSREIENLGNRKEIFYRQAAEAGVALLPGVRPLLGGLHAAGLLQAIGSSAPRANLDLILRLTRTAHLFEAMVSMEDTQRGKPHPEVFLTAAAKLGVPPEGCLVMEDAPVGVEAAKAGGMKCIAVTFAGHHPAERLRDAGADVVVDSLEQVDVALVHRLLRGDSNARIP
jgi:beta-phosphoglucomutase family hydrolase